ncbi:MAG: hypothetical protein KDM63_00675 [Verrucomicrobiae bacterium]|nr:hypothetical protein [Verrucomicrobiae bacterium]MCB1085531.1 hypothetical protein [Verrucomicrobiae bacterium]
MMNRPFSILLLPMALLLGGCQTGPKPIPDVIVVAPESEVGAVDFKKDIAPVLERKCIVCHFDHAPLTALSFQRKKNMLEDTNGRPVLVPGDPQHSTIFLVTVMPDYFIEAMPAGGHQLAKEETSKLYHWIEAGAPWPEGLVLQPETEL